jgi:hypothetical protein
MFAVNAVNYDPYGILILLKTVLTPLNINRHQRKQMYKETQAAPLPPQLDSFVSKAAVAHMIIHLLDLFTPLHFSWGGEIFFMNISFGHCQSINHEPVAQTWSKDICTAWTCSMEKPHGHAAWTYGMV